MNNTNKIVSLIAFLVLLAACTHSNEPTIYKLYFLGGQSNMEGFGYVAELPAAAAAIVRRRHDFHRTDGAGQRDARRCRHLAATAARIRHGLQNGWQAVSCRIASAPSCCSDRRWRQARRAARIAIIKYALGGSGLADGVGFGNWHPDFSKGAGLNQYDHALKTLRTRLRSPISTATARPIA